MKQKNVLTGIVATLLCLLVSVTLDAQTTDQSPRFKEIPSFTLPVTSRKTTNIVFPFSIKSVDRGSKDVLAQIAKGVTNVLQVKAGTTGFDETNLSVITGNGRLYSFRVVYEENPGLENLSLVTDTISPQFSALPDKHQVQLSGVPLDEGALRFGSDKARHAEKFLHKRTSGNGIKLILRSIYAGDKVMWYTLEVKNYSLLDYQPAFIRFFLEDNKKAKRTTQQQLELTPLYIDDSVSVPGNQSRAVVLAFPQFTIPDDQHLLIQMGEQSGSRTVSLPIKQKTVLQTRVLP